MEKRPLQREPVSSFDIWRFRLEGLLLRGEAKMDTVCVLGVGETMHPELKWGYDYVWAGKDSRDWLESHLVSQLSELLGDPSPAPAQSWHLGPSVLQEHLGSDSARFLG